MSKNFGLAFILILFISPALAESRVPAKVLEVIDGDTIRVEAYPWPGDIKRVLVRFAGVDTPELRGKCEEERRLAVEARAFVESGISGTVVLRRPELGKYAGRVVAEVFTENGDDIALLLILAGLGVPYSGGSREDWC